MDTPLLSRHLGTFDTLTFNVIRTITNAISKNLPSSGTKWPPIMTYIHPPCICVMTSNPVNNWSIFRSYMSNLIHIFVMLMRRICVKVKGESF